jgi:hypothetical protein
LKQKLDALPTVKTFTDREEASKITHITSNGVIQVAASTILTDMRNFCTKWSLKLKSLTVCPP